MTTGQMIKRARKHAGLTQIELGKKIGVSGSMIGQWENDLRNPKAETIEKLSNATGVDISGSLLSHKFSEHNPLKDMFNDYPLLEAFYKLNKIGQKVAIERIEELTKIPEYQKTPPDDLQPPTEKQ